MFLFPFLCGTASAADATAPNIVFIISDDQAWTDYGFMDHPLIQTPRLDELAARSALFTRGYVPTALCRPSLATMITGLYSHQHKISGNDPSVTLAAPASAEYAELRRQLIGHIDRQPTVPKLLAQRGYLSHQSGKWWEGPYQRGGFTHGMTRGFPEPGGRHGDDGLAIGRQGLQPVVDFVDHAVREAKPFFLWYAPFLPHTPHNPPERLLAKYRDRVDSLHVAKYYAMCEWFDETCGELMDLIEAKGLTDKTLFVYVGDNGWIQDPQSSKHAAADHAQLARRYPAGPPRRSGQQHRLGPHHAQRRGSASPGQPAGARSDAGRAGRPAAGQGHDLWRGVRARHRRSGNPGGFAVVPLGDRRPLEAVADL
jgi:uncharacterized sulfatase